MKSIPVYGHSSVWPVGTLVIKDSIYAEMNAIATGLKKPFVLHYSFKDGKIVDFCLTNLEAKPKAEVK